MSFTSQAHYTPGPWFCTRRSDWNAICTVGRAWNISTKLALSHFGHADLDAQLIASAPELLEALQAIVKSMVDADDEGLIEYADEIQNARRVIAKATATAQEAM